MAKTVAKKLDKVVNPLEITRRLDAHRAVIRGETLKPQAPTPLDPKDLTSTQKNVAIEYLKYSEALSNVEIADYLKINRHTVASRLKIIDTENRQELETKGISVWDAVYELKRTKEYIKKRARILNDPDLYLRAVVTYINQCQKLGVIYEKPQQVAVALLPAHSPEEERIIIKHYQDEYRRKLEALKERERIDNATLIEPIQSD